MKEPIAEKMIKNPKLDLKEIKTITGLTIEQLNKMKKEALNKKKKVTQSKISK